MSQEGGQWRVLAVDDDPEKLDELERIFGRGMGDNQFLFTKATSFDEGVELVDTNRFDFVFLDVHEDSGDPDPGVEPRAEDQRGEGLLRHLQSIRFLPVVFYTGYPEKVRHLESLVVRVVEKGVPVGEIREAVQKLLDTKLPQLLRYLEEQSRSYMWESLEGLLTNHQEDIDESEVSLILARRLAASLSQNVVKDLLGMDANQIRPLEMYQYPPIEQSCNPADIYKRKDDGSLWMVFTPACDFEQNKAENVLLASVIPLVDHPLYQVWQEKAAAYEAIAERGEGKKEAKTTRNKARGAVISLVKGGGGERYKFLPGTFFLPDCVVDFQNLLNFPRDDSGYEVICSMDNPYREELLHLFSKYYGRIGTPDYDSDPVWSAIETKFSPH
ncbi:MAG: response regulator [Thiovulaceae bacterium]|nr:response regulator [Sulfurimonadaceae bacterium]